jgi:hypothetical protein
MMGHLRRWCPPEELKLDVVGVTEGEHGVLCVRRLLDARMPYSKEIETLGPLVQIRPLSDQELKVVQAGMSSLKGPWGPPSTRPGNFEPGPRRCQTCVALTFVWRLVLTADRKFQHFPIPADASIQVGHGERWGQIARNRWHGLILPICVVGRLPAGSMVGKTG